MQLKKITGTLLSRIGDSEARERSEKVKRDACININEDVSKKKRYCLLCLDDEHDKQSARLRFLDDDGGFFFSSTKILCNLIV